MSKLTQVMGDCDAHSFEADRQPIREPLYSVGTWDGDADAYTVQDGLTVGSINVGLPELRQALRELRQAGYPANRIRDRAGEYHSDWAVLVERTDGEPEASILERWKR